MLDAVTLASDLDLATAVARLEPFGDASLVVVVRRTDERTYHYIYDAGQIRAVAERIDRDGDLTVARVEVVLDLHEWMADPEMQVTEARERPAGRTVVLDGDRVLGVTEPARRTTRSTGELLVGTAPPDPAPPPAPPAYVPHPPHDAEPVASPAEPASPVTGPAPPLREGAPPSARPPPRVPPRSAPPETSPPPAGVDEAATGTLFQAEPRTDAPAAVTAGDRFDLVVGLAPPDTTSDAAPAISIEVADAPAAFDLVVQVLAPEFGAPEGVRRFLHVDRAAGIGATSVSFALVPEDVDARRHRTLEVEFSHEGTPVGRAWRDIEVVPAGVTAEAVRPTATGAAPLTSAPLAPAADLTVTIAEGDDEGHFAWLFTSPHDITLPTDEGIDTRLLRDNARSFAQRILRDVPRKDGSPLIDQTVLGAAREVSRATPHQLWGVLEQVWHIARQQDRPPTLLITSSELYVPWELASMERDWFDPELLDPAAPPLLGAQAIVGRWLSPQPRTPRGGERPVQPPYDQVDIDAMAVVVGDYLQSTGVRDLPEARAEGRTLLSRYGGVALTATDDDMDRLLAGRLTRADAPVDVQAIHFACHGVVDLDNPSYNGIVLNDDRHRLDAMTVAGNTIGARTEPFVFVNACQLGTNDEGLVGNLGYAGAFLYEGFRGFVAPLWAVDDEVARRYAETFYQRTLDDGVPVGEAVRELRTRFDTTEDDAPPSTYLAYVYYGHPSLRLTHIGR